MLPAEKLTPAVTALREQARARGRAVSRHVCRPVAWTVEDVSAGEGFDAVVLDNVLEHVPDPVATLRRAWSLVRAAGRLIVLTPNAASYGHARFGARWRGLEPPRHLVLFTPISFAAAALRAGVPSRVRTTPRALPFMWIASGGTPRSLPSLAVAYLREARGGAGEELLLDAVKSAS